MSDPHHLRRLLDVLESELRTPRGSRTSGATDESLRSAIIDAHRTLHGMSLSDAFPGLTGDDPSMASPSSPQPIAWWSQLRFDPAADIEAPAAPRNAPEGRLIDLGFDR